MAKLILALLVCVSAHATPALQLDLYAQATLPSKIDLKGERVGGLSGLAWDGKTLLAISDDRGKFGAPRFYDLDLKSTPGKVEFTPKQSHPITGLPTEPKWVLDMESIVLMPKGDLLLTTEGDNTTIPRSLPHIFITSRDGHFKQDLPIPDKFLPELKGSQEKGLENDRAFEGLAVTPSGDHIYAINEYPILTDNQKIDERGLWLRMIEYSKDKDSYKPTAEYPYLLDQYTRTGKGPEVYRGVSELLYYKNKQFLTIERGVRFLGKGIGYTGGIYWIDLQGAGDVSKIACLVDTKVPAIKKEKLVDFEELLKDQKIENFEGLAWGPVLPDGRKSLLVMNDNNFSDKEKNQLLVFAVKEGK